MINRPLYIFVFLCLFSQATTLLAQSNRVSEEEVNTQKVFIDANREKILGNYENAVFLYKEVLKRDRKNAAAAYELARIYDVLDKRDKSFGSINMAIELEPDNEWYQIFLADVLEKDDKFEAAAEVYEKLCEKEPNSEYYHTKWAFFLVKANKPGKAIKVYDLMEEKSGVTEELIRKKHSLYIGMGNIKKAIGELEKLIEVYPGNMEYRHDLAAFYLQLNEEKKAKEIYSEILSLDPENGKAALAMAGAAKASGQEVGYLNSMVPIFKNPEIGIDLKMKELIPFIHRVADGGDPDVATASIELAEILANVHPDEAKTYSAYGDLLYYSGQKADALKRYEKAIELDATVFTIWEQMLYIQTELKQYDALVKSTETAMDIFPNQAKVYYFNGIGNGELAQHKNAISSFQQAMVMSRKNQRLQADILKRLGTSYAALKNYNQSDKSFEKALEINPEDYLALNLYSHELARRNTELDKARSMALKANELLPNQPAFQDTYGWVLYKSKSYKEAHEWLGKALSNGGNDMPTILEHYGDILFQLDEVDQALQYWQQALDKGSKSSTLEKKIADRQLYE